MQRTLMDRRRVYDLLAESGIDVPHHVYASRDGYVSTSIQRERGYPSSAGGGCKKLFRKVGDRSSLFYPEINEIRRDGSYIYESFVETQGTDVKMYTVGPDYGHAEARKSPAIDGKVKRNADGKEVRFPVILTLREKEIARR